MIPTIAEAAKLIAAKKLSPVELTQACLGPCPRTGWQAARFRPGDRGTRPRGCQGRRSRDHDGRPDQSAARHPDRPEGHRRHRRHPTTCQSQILQDNVPDTDATCAAKLAAAGSVLMGKLTTHEFADGGPSFDLPKPPAANPWNTEHFTAGSSSGTGAAVAAGMILCGIGTDTGGSIRGPAALCGIAGIKPTYGLVSRAGVAPAAFSLDHIGPMAWTAEDCAIMLQALAGHDPRDPASADQPIPDYTALIGNRPERRQDRHHPPLP